MPQVLINGTSWEVPEGSVLSALRSAEVHVPALCHDDRVMPCGACRTCLVRVKGHSRLLTACTTAVTQGMEIETDTPELERARRGILEMLVRKYPASAFALSPDKPFHQEIHRAGLTNEASTGVPSGSRIDRSHPYIAIDMERCIDCHRCVRICAELQGQFVWHVRGRGSAIRVEPDGPTLRDSSCVGCGACVDTCPTGAIDDALVADRGGPTQWTRTTCPYCGVGCELNVGTHQGAIVSVTPVLDAPVSKGHLCVKGRYAFGFVSAADRITEPMLRDRSEWRRVSWEEATTFVAGRLRSLVARHGPGSVGILGSARATNEDNYVTQKFARAVVGTNNVDCCARVCHAPSAAALKAALGTGLATNSFDDIERARTLLVCGANVTEDHPVLGARIKQAVLRGARLIVIDPRRIELADHAHCHLAPRPGTNVALFNALAHTVITEGLCDRAFVEERVCGFDEFEASVASWSPERVASTCGLPPEMIRAAARMYATGGPAMAVHGLGLTEHVQGTDGVTSLINLALLTGNIGRPGAGVNPLRGQNNVQGASHMGCDPGVLPGSVALEQGRRAAESLWEASVPLVPGLHLLEMMDAAAERRLKGLWVVGYDVLMTNPDTSASLRALRALSLVIVQDMFLTETARECGTVFLPACSSFEKEGTFMNAERRIQRVRAALRPLGSSRPDWRIVCEVAKAMGAQGFAFSNPQEIWDEVRALCAGARGMTYARLERGGLQWPCPTEAHPGTPMLHTDTFDAGPRATLRPVTGTVTPEVSTEQYPLLLITGRSLYQFNAGTMTSRTANEVLRPTDVLDMAPSDAARCGCRDGDLVRLTSRYGTTTLPLRISPRMQPGQVFATFQTARLHVNAVTGPHRDSHVGTPEYKVTAVLVERCGGEAGADA